MPLPVSMRTRSIMQDEEMHRITMHYVEENPVLDVNSSVKKGPKVSYHDELHHPLSTKKSILVNNLHEFLLKSSNHTKSRTNNKNSKQQPQSSSSPDTNASSYTSDESRNGKNSHCMLHHDHSHSSTSTLKYDEIRESESIDIYYNYNTKISEKENSSRNRSFRIDRNRSKIRRIDNNNDSSTTLKKKECSKHKNIDKRKNGMTPSTYLHERQTSRKGVQDKKSSSTTTSSTSTCPELNISARIRSYAKRGKSPSRSLSSPLNRKNKKSKKKNRNKHQSNVVTPTSASVSCQPSINRVMWSKSTWSNSRSIKNKTTPSKKPKVRKLSVHQKQELYSKRPDLMPDHWCRYSRLRHYILRRTWALELAVSESINNICSLSFDDDYDNNDNAVVDEKICMCL